MFFLKIGLFPHKIKFLLTNRSKCIIMMTLMKKKAQVQELTIIQIRKHVLDNQKEIFTNFSDLQ